MLRPVDQDSTGCADLRRQEVGDAEEVGDVRARRFLVRFLRRSDLLDHTLVHHGKAVAHGQRLLLIVGDVDERDAHVLVERAEFDLQRLAQLRVERAERLVEQQDLRAQHQRPGESDALLLAT